MTTNPLLATLIPLVADLSRDLPEDERYRRLLQALRDLLPCDATALLRLDGEYLAQSMAYCISKLDKIKIGYINAGPKTKR